MTFLSMVAVLLGAALLTAACAAPPGETSDPKGGGPFVRLEAAPEERVPFPAPEDSLGAGEVLEYPPVPEEMSLLLDRVAKEFGHSPDYGTSEISLDREVLILRWYGEPPTELVALGDEYADAPFEIRLDETQYRTGELSAESRRLLEENPGVVTSAGPRNEGDGVNVGIDPDVATRPDAALLESLGITSGFPLFPESMSAPVPISGAGPMG